MKPLDRILLPWRLPFFILGILVHIVAFVLLAVLALLMFRPRIIPDYVHRFFGSF